MLCDSLILASFPEVSASDMEGILQEPGSEIPASDVETVPQEPASDSDVGDLPDDLQVLENGGEMDDFLETDVLDPSSDDSVSSDPDSLAPSDSSDSDLSDSGSEEFDSGQENQEDQDVSSEDTVSGDASSDPDLVIYDGQLYTDDGVPVDLLGVLPASVTASNSVYTPTAWQINLAEHRSFGEHYLMWAQRLYTGSTYYWRYFLALGRDMSYSSGVYSYVDAEVYSYYSYNSSATYDVSVSSGSVSGSTYLVYSDLYFDYVGVDPAASSSVYIFFPLLILIIALLMIGGKRNV